MKAKVLRLSALGALLLLLPAAGWCAGYSAGTLPRIVLHDAARNRNVPLRVYYPKSPRMERFPVIVFSHGAGGSKDGYEFLGRYWAEHGYVVIHPTHPGSDRSLLKSGRPLVNLKVLRKMLEEPANFALRPQDIAFVLNSLPNLAEENPALKNKMDPTRVGVGGHSFGAYTSLAVAGAWVYPPGEGKRTFGDTRPMAYLALSPQGAGTSPFRPGSWKSVARPAFIVTGTEDRGLGQESALWRTQAYAGLRPGHKYLAVIHGANHMDFSDTQFDGRVRDRKVHVWLQRATLLFWDCYLKRDANALARLKSEGWPEVKGVKVRTANK